MIDAYGYRLNVGIVLTDGAGKVFLGKRINQDAWQFPQGGLNEGESIEGALYRELLEEVGLQAENVVIIGHTRQWLKYKLPSRYVRSSGPTCIGQKQKWFLLKLIGQDSDIRLEVGNKPEFDDWRWVNYWFPLTRVIHFKREVYRRALKELLPVFLGSNVRNASIKNLNSIMYT